MSRIGSAHDLPIFGSMRSSHTRAHQRLLRACVGFAVAAAVATSAGIGTAATSGSVVGATVPSATQLLTACQGGSASTSFGAVTPGSLNVTTAPCTITFGSSNNTSMLQVYQGDRTGDAMFAHSTGARVASFGTAGTARWDAPGGVDDEDLQEIAMLPDGTGRFYAGIADDDDAVIARFQANGSLDTTFSSGDGTNGYAVLNDNISAVNWLRVVVQPDGKLVVASWNSIGETGVFLTRLLPTGATDTSYGTAGVTRVDPCDVNAAQNHEWYGGALLDRRGRLVLAGGCSYVDGSDEAWWVLRFTDTGQPDAAFAGDGSWDWNPSAQWEWAGDVVEQPDGKLVVVGESRAGGTARTTLVRFLEDGTLDPAFDGDGTNGLGGNGLVGYTIPGKWQNQPSAVALDGTGRIVVASIAGEWSDAGNETGVLRVSATGARDLTFDGDGWAVHAIGVGTREAPGEVLAWPDGSVTLAGWVGNAGSEDAYVARLTASGALDPRFDGDGVATTDLPVGVENTGSHLELARDGQLLTGGNALVAPGNYEPSFTLFDAATVSDYSDTGAAGDRDWSSDPATTSTFGMCLAALGGTASTSSIVPDAGGNCGATDVDDWHAVPDGPGTPSKLATMASGVENGTASLHFGLRVGGSLPSGAYYAPILFEVIAPNA